MGGPLGSELSNIRWEISYRVCMVKSAVPMRTALYLETKEKLHPRIIVKRTVYNMKIVPMGDVANVTGLVPMAFMHGLLLS